MKGPKRAMPRRRLWGLGRCTLIHRIVGAVISLSAVLLVVQHGQPRIFCSMARDGPLPDVAAKLHPGYRTPHVTTIFTGVLVAGAALAADDVATYELTNIGTRFECVLVALASRCCA